MAKRQTEMPPPPARIIGTIVRLVNDRGFGFVRDNTGHEYFFHRSACPDFDDLTNGRTVTFLPGQGPKGLRAEAVELDER